MEPPPTFGIKIPHPPALPLGHSSFEGLRIALLYITEELADAPLIVKIRGTTMASCKLVDDRFLVMKRAENLCAGILLAIDPHASVSAAITPRNLGQFSLIADALFVYRANMRQSATQISASACLKILRIHTLVKNASNYAYAPTHAQENYVPIHDLVVPTDAVDTAARQDTTLPHPPTPWVALRIPRAMITSRYPCVLNNMQACIHDRCEKCRRLAAFDIRSADTQLRWAECYKRRMVQLLSGYAMQLFSIYTRTVCSFGSVLTEYPHTLMPATPAAFKVAEACIASNSHLEFLVLYLFTGSLAVDSKGRYDYWLEYKAAQLVSRVQTGRSPELPIEVRDPDYVYTRRGTTVWKVLSLWSNAVLGTGYWAFRGAASLVNRIKGSRLGYAANQTAYAAIAHGYPIAVAATEVQEPTQIVRINRDDEGDEFTESMV